MPFLVQWKREVKPGTVVQDPCFSLDIFPTILDIAGIPKEKAREGLRRPRFSGFHLRLARDERRARVQIGREAVGPQHGPSQLSRPLPLDQGSAGSALGEGQAHLDVRQRGQRRVRIAELPAASWVEDARSIAAPCTPGGPACEKAAQTRP